MPENILYYGDNLDILRRYIKDETIDLIYLDPPFNSNQDYNVLFAEQNGTKSASQIKVFEDTWHWSQEAEGYYTEVVAGGGRPSEVIQAFRNFLGENDMMAYLATMAPRLIEMRRVLKSTGSIYLHCDPTASHYLKILMDAIFDPRNFRNEIIWRRTGSHAPSKKYAPIHDTILFYSKTLDYYFQVKKRPYMRGHVESRFTKEVSSGLYKFTSGGNILTGAGSTGGESGQPWRGFNPTAKNRHWAIPGFLTEQMPPEFERLGVLDKLEHLYQEGLIEIKEGAAWPTPVRYLKPEDGQPIADIWAAQPYTNGTVFGMEEIIDADVRWLGTTDPERSGYQTQKPIGLLERIMESSCPEKGVILDPFCGCGTTVIAAQKLGFPWIGIDITHLAIALIKHRLKESFGDQVVYKVLGEPVSLSDAEELAKEDKYQFQWWALGLVGARPVEKKKGADKGIDGILYFFEKPNQTSTAKQIIFSVKGGTVGVKDVRDLRGVITREKAAIGVLISLKEPTSAMVTEAASAGFYSFSGVHTLEYPKIQLLTIAELLNGKNVKCPPLVPRGGNVTLRKPKTTKIKKKENDKQVTLRETEQDYAEEEIVEEGEK